MSHLDLGLLSLRSTMQCVGQHGHHNDACRGLNSVGPPPHFQAVVASLKVSVHTL
jgi:hypothetical protein